VPAAADPSLPGSLRGTSIGGALVVGEDGRFLPTPDALALFDYFLSASGEEPEAAIRQRIVNEIQRRLTGDAARDAEALLDTYLGFRSALADLSAARWVPEGLERRLQWIRELRREHFGPELSAVLFAESEGVQAVDLERRRIALDPELGKAEREAELAALEAELPAPVREARERARAPALANREIAALRAGGASERDVFAARERRFGPEAAARLAALDAERALWARRFDAYQRERAGLLAAGEADPEQLEALRARHFDDEEARRVRALGGDGRP
jgi:lipase chaperone LimK